MMTAYINQKHQKMVDTVYRNFVSYYAGKYNVEKVCQPNGVISVIISQGEANVNRYDFYGDRFHNGNLASVAIYGAGLSRTLNAIQASKRCFGLPVARVDLDTSGMSPYVDVYFDDLSFVDNLL